MKAEKYQPFKGKKANNKTTTTIAGLTVTSKELEILHSRESTYSTISSFRCMYIKTCISATTLTSKILVIQTTITLIASNFRRISSADLIALNN